MLSALVAFTLSPLIAQLPQQEAKPSVPPETVVVSRDGTYAEVIRQQQVRPLSGSLDGVPMFNSNSPEVVQQEGILLSTFPPEGMGSPEAHLNYAFQGRFDLFAHHIARGINPDDRRTLFLAVVVYNPGPNPVRLRINQAVSYLSQEAPFIDLPEARLSINGNIFAGPGSRTASDILRGATQAHWPTSITVPPGNVSLLMNMPIPLRQLKIPLNGSYAQGEIIPKPPQQPVSLAAADGQLQQETLDGSAPVSSPPAPRPIPSNGRTTMMYLTSDGPVYLASLARYASTTESGNEQVPSLQDWLQVLKQGKLAGPRDIPPSDPSTYQFGRFYYGRVAGVAMGSSWQTRLTDNANSSSLTIPDAGNSFSYVISSVDRNTFGTGQIQSAPMVVRYPDTAFRAHGNYGVRYSLTLPLRNNLDVAQTVSIKFQTPLEGENLTNGLRFRRPPENRVFFRGTVRLRFKNPLGLEQNHYFHLVQRRGQESNPLVTLTIPPQSTKEVEVELVYPPDATPPQVITVLNNSAADVFQAQSSRSSTNRLSRDF
ncbi:MAG: DUF3370 family protein [Cyanobacteria bacterium REEB459]|nr:DUF3370 family protein [Cyanobacteria bacterium REEB459]